MAAALGHDPPIHMDIPRAQPRRRRGAPSGLPGGSYGKRAFILAAMVASAVLGPNANPAQFMTTSNPRQGEEQRILAAEDEYVAAEVTRDEATLRRLVDDRFVFNSGKGTVTGKEDFIQTVLNLAMTGQTIRERSVLIEGDVALVFGTAELRFADPGKEDSVQTLRYTSTYVLRQGQWRMLALQMQQRATK
jgi:ketosteroid isomerase-like protein